ncbi:MAG: PEGA domain-containing protein [bacterium]
MEIIIGIIRTILAIPAAIAAMITIKEKREKGRMLEMVWRICITLCISIGIIIPVIMYVRPVELTITDLPSKILSREKTISIPIKGEIKGDVEKFRDWRIFIVNRSVGWETWQTQKPGIVPAKEWEIKEVYLGGEGYPPRDGEEFEVAAIMIKGEIKDAYTTLQHIPYKSKIGTLAVKIRKEIPSPTPPPQPSEPSTTPSPPTEQTLTISSIPPGAEIYLDGEMKGKTPKSINVSVGIHLIEIAKDSYEVWRKEITITEGEAPEGISAPLTPLNERYNLTVTSDPPGAKIYLRCSEPDREYFRGITPTTLSISSGRHTLILKKEGYKEMEDIKRIEEGDRINWYTPCYVLSR